MTMHHQSYSYPFIGKFVIPKS